jgi:hypothetical protein
LGQALSQIRERFSSDGGFVFLEATSALQGQPNCDLRLVPLSTKLLALAAMEAPHDESDLQLLMNMAMTLSADNNQGFALLQENGIPAHVCSVVPFEGARIPGLNEPLREPAPNSVLLLLSWTSEPFRSPTREAEFASVVAAHLLENGKRPWVFSRDRDTTQLRQAGFVPRFSLVRTRRMFFGGTSAVEFTTQGADHAIGLYPAA